MVGFPLKPGHKPQFLASSLLIEVLDFANVMVIYGRGIKEHEVLLKEPKNSVLQEGSLYGSTYDGLDLFLGTDTLKESVCSSRSHRLVRPQTCKKNNLMQQVYHRNL